MTVLLEIIILRAFSALALIYCVHHNNYYLGYSVIGMVMLQVSLSLTATLTASTVVPPTDSGGTRATGREHSSSLQ